MMDIEINASNLNLETNLILYLYHEKCIKFNQLKSLIRSREIWNFARHVRLIYRIGKNSLILKNRFLIFLYYIQKSKKLKVSTLDIRIKQSGLKVSHSKVPSSEHIILFPSSFLFSFPSFHFFIFFFLS